MKRIICLMIVVMAAFSTVTASAADWDWVKDGIGDIVSEYEPYAETVKKVWDKQSLEKIIQGKFAVPDETINLALAQQIDGDERVKSLSITSKESGRVEIHATTKKYGTVELSGTIDAFVHDGDTSYMTYTVKNKDMKEHGGVTGWMFSHLSLSLIEKLVGPITLSDSLPTTVKGNSITVDYNQALKNSELAKASVANYNLLDALRIKGAVPHDGYIEFQTALNLPPRVQQWLLDILD